MKHHRNVKVIVIVIAIAAKTDIVLIPIIVISVLPIAIMFRSICSGLRAMPMLCFSLHTYGPRPCTCPSHVSTHLTSAPLPSHRHCFLHHLHLHLHIHLHLHLHLHFVCSLIFIPVLISSSVPL